MAGWFVWSDYTAGGNLVPQPGIKPVPIAVRALCPNNQIACQASPQAEFITNELMRTFSSAHFHTDSASVTLISLWFSSQSGIFSSWTATGLLPAFSFRFLRLVGQAVRVGVGGKVNAKGRARWNDQEFSVMPFLYLLPDHPELSRPAPAYLFFLSFYSSCQVWCLVDSVHHVCFSSPLRSFKADLSLLKTHTV